MKSTAAIQIGALLAGGLLLTGCSGDSGPSASTTLSTAPEASTSASSPATPSPTSTLTAEQQQAFEEATEVVRAYEQMFYDILADTQPNLNDMNKVAAQPQVAVDLRNLQKILASGGFEIQSTGQTVILSSQLVSIDLGAEPPAAVIEACVDQSAAEGTQDGVGWTGPREIAHYRVVRTSYLPAPGWAVAQVLPPEGFDQPRPC